MMWAVLVSGSGTILECMVAAGLRPDLVLADRPGTRAIEVVAKMADLRTKVIDRRAEFGYIGGISPWRRDDFTAAINHELKSLAVELVAMAGFDTVLSSTIFETYGGKILNTHPALLPAFAGLHGSNVIRATLDAGVKTAGCTIHIATETVDDSSNIVAQKEVPVMACDTVQTLWERIKIEERKLYPQVIQGILSGQRTLPLANAII